MWTRDQVLALAPDAASRKAADKVGAPAKWSGTGAAHDAVWGECAGSGGKRYRSCVDVSAPAYRCDCPSRKIPCKHVLGLLLLWSSGEVAPAAEPPGWVAEWLERRRARAAERPAKAAAAGRPGTGTAARRESRVAAGLAELELWLTDRVAQGIAQARTDGPAEWTELARRLVDAQAPGLADRAGLLARALGHPDWPDRLLGEYALLYLLAAAYRRSSGLPADLVATVRARIGFPVPRESVLATTPVRDRWDVIGCRDEERDRLITRRVWLMGRESGRPALVLSHAPAGRSPDGSLVTGTTIDADLAFYPGSAPLRALVAERYGLAAAGPPPGIGLTRLPGLIAEVLAADPWTDSWPVVLAGVVPAADGLLLDEEGNALPLHPSAGVPWRLLAVSGGRPVTVAAEWTPDGLRPLTAWDEEGTVVQL